MIANGTLTGTIGPDGNINDAYFKISKQSQKGEILINDQITGAYIYKPFADVNGHDSFEFVYNDGVMDSVAAQISITIQPVDDPPFAWGDDFTFYEDTPATGFISASDADFDVLTFTILKQPQKGSVQCHSVRKKMKFFISNDNK